MKSTSVPCITSLRQYLLVSFGMGLEATFAFEAIQMVGNIQMLGVPYHMTALGLIVTSSINVVFIPFVGMVMQRWATSKKAKAFVACFVSLIVISGNAFVLVGNLIKLWKANESKSFESLSYSADLSSPSSALFLEPLQMTTNSTGTDSLFESLLINETITNKDGGMDASSSLPLEGIWALVGYSLAEMGCDSANSALKTFIVAAVSAEDSGSALIKVPVMASFGAGLICILGFLDLGGPLVAGTSRDSNAAHCALLASIVLVMLLATLALCLATGLSSGGAENSESYRAETVYQDIPDRQEEELQSTPSSSPGENTSILSFPAQQVPAQWTIKRWLNNHKMSLLICTGMLCLAISVFPFNLYLTDYAGRDVFFGDPDAIPDSEEYWNYVRGLRIASGGIFVTYITYGFFNMVHEAVFKRLGWKKELLLILAVHLTLTSLCAWRPSVLTFYLICASFGLVRTEVCSIPFILCNKAVTDQNGGHPGNAALAIAAVTVMIPASTVLCSLALPLLAEYWGDVVMALYIAVATGLLAMLVFCLVKV